VYLLATTIVRLTDIGVDCGYITGYSIEVLVAGSQDQFKQAGFCVPQQTDDEGDLVAEAGKAIVDRLHVSLVDEGGDSLYVACDADSSQWEAVFAGFLCEDGDQGFYQEISQTADCCSRDVLLIRDILVKPEYQSRGLEMAVAERIIETFGSCCDLVVYDYGDQTNELEALTPIGFRPGPIQGHAFLNLNHQHPKVQQDGFCKFVASPGDDTEVQAWFWCLHCEHIWLGSPGAVEQCPRAKRGECDGSPIDALEVGKGKALPLQHWPPISCWNEGDKLPAYTNGAPNASA
jgi:GNAT superfamily N-acetyltransferase